MKNDLKNCPDFHLILLSMIPQGNGEYIALVIHMFLFDGFCRPRNWSCRYRTQSINTWTSHKNIHRASELQNKFQRWDDRSVYWWNRTSPCLAHCIFSTYASRCCVLFRKPMFEHALNCQSYNNTKLTISQALFKCTMKLLFNITQTSMFRCGMGMFSPAV